MDLLRGSDKEREFALQSIYSANRKKGIAYVLANNGSTALAKDVFQESMIAFYENVRDGRFKGDSSISTYLYSIIKFKWLNQLKKSKVRQTHHDKLEITPVNSNALNRMIDEEEKQFFLEVLAELGANCKQLLIENLYHNRSMKEIAEKEGFSSEQIVRNKKYKCLKKLRALVAARPSLELALKNYG